MKNKETLQAVMDRRLSFLDGLPSCRPALMQRIAQEEAPVMKKKVSFVLVFALVLVSLSVVALAAGLILSPRVTAAQLADRELEKAYGITYDMQTFFARAEEELEDGTFRVTYTGAGALEAPLGVYTVDVKDGKAKASWNLDGKDTSGGYDAEAWGLEQIAQMLTDSRAEDGTEAYIARAEQLWAENHPDEDLNAPSDVRNYQPGDAMKKIHWKLSLRKGELMVRKYDEPVLQEALILMDCSRPPGLGHPDAEADLRDALLETGASLFSDQIREDHTVRMPLTGDHPVDLDERMGIRIAFDYLAKLDFSAAERFEQVLMMESRRLGKIGCVAVVAARLNGTMVEMMIRMHRMGPNLRVYLVTFVPDDPGITQLAGKLEHAGIEVEYVAPEVNR